MSESLASIWTFSLRDNITDGEIAQRLLGVGVGKQGWDREFVYSLPVAKKLTTEQFVRHPETIFELKKAILRTSEITQLELAVNVLEYIQKRLL